jgi:hypothetical protein
LIPRLQAALEQLLDLGEEAVRTREAAWQKQKQAGEEEARKQQELDRRAKAATLQRFDLVAIPKLAGKKKQEAVPLPLTTSTSSVSDSKVRFRDGQAVSFKGEKFVIERTGDEWDGGSRGKVYTKGKRGKGFV